MREAGVGADDARTAVGGELDEVGGVLRALLELDAGVEVLGVLSDDDEVDVVVARAVACDRERGTQARVQVELLADGDVHAAEAGADGRGDRALDGDLVLADGVERGLRQRRAVLVDEVGACLGDLPGDVDAGRLDDATHRGRELGADAVSGDECHGVLGHAVFPPGSVAAHSVRQRTRATGARAHTCIGDCTRRLAVATTRLGGRRSNGRPTVRRATRS